MAEDFEKLRARYRLRFIEGAQARIDRGLQPILNQSHENALTSAGEVRSLAGRNLHHRTESLFKAFALALRQAAAIDPRRSGIPSTKGSL